MTHHTITSKRIGSRFRFIGETIAELKKVVWLSRREAIYLTTLVLIVAAAMGLILGAVDYGFTQLVEKLFMIDLLSAVNSFQKFFLIPPNKNLLFLVF